MRSDEEQGYCAVSYQNVNREQVELYIQALVDDGWHTIRDFYENTTIGGLYEKGTMQSVFNLPVTSLSCIFP